MRKANAIITKSLIFISVCFTFFNLSSAQNSRETNLNNDTSYNISPFGHPNAERDMRNKVNSDLIYAIEQSDELRWQDMSLTVDGKLEIVLGRYNPIHDSIEIKYNDAIHEIVKRNNMNITFMETNTTYQVKSYYGADDKIHMSYFIVDDFSDELGVFKRESFKKNELKQHKKKTNGSIYFDKNDIYYIIDQEHKLFYLTTDRNIIRKSYPKKASSIIKFIKKNELTESRYDDMITLARYIKNNITDE